MKITMYELLGMVKDGKGWCNANISLENGTLVVKPYYDLLFDD